MQCDNCRIVCGPMKWLYVACVAVAVAVAHHLGSSAYHVAACHHQRAFVAATSHGGSSA